MRYSETPHGAPVAINALVGRGAELGPLARIRTT